MAELIDPVDIEGYEDVVDRYSLRKASSYLDNLQAEFKPRVGPQPDMFSTKLRGVLQFRPGEVTCWAGYSGHRKSMFVGQVALDLIAQKRRVMIASFEMSPAATLARMARQAWGKQTPTPEELARFAAWTDGKLWIFDHFGHIQPSKVLAMCRYFEQEKMGHAAFIDSMMMVCKSEEHLDEQKQFMTNTVRLAQETGLQTHVVAHSRKPSGDGEKIPPTKYDIRGSASITDQAHNVVTIWANKSKKTKIEEGDLSVINDADALVTVEKQRNGQWEGRCKLWFDEGSMRFRDDSTAPLQPYAGLPA